MEILIGRLTADAKISTTKDEKKVVNFSIAINDSYKSKGSGEVKKITTYVNCSYWLSTGIAEFLKKAALVELCGRIGVSVWKDMQGEPKGSLTFHVTNIKLYGGAKVADGNANALTVEQPQEVNASDDLPF